MLTEQKKLFAEEFLKLRCKNQTQAAINAGYSIKSAPAQSTRLMKDCEVREYLKKLKNELSQELRQEFLFDALQARNVMYEILNNDSADDRDRISVAKDFLDRAGFKAKEKIEHSGEIKTEVSELSDEQIEKEIKKMRSELGLDANG